MKLRKSSSSRSSSSKKQQQQKNDQLQQRGSNSSRKKRQAAANVVQANPHLDAIPEEIMVMLASRFLSPADVAAAASCCVGWSRVLRKGVSSVTLEVGGEDRKAAKRTAKALSKTSVSELELLLSTRSQYGCLRALLASKPLLPQVKRLQLRFLLSKTSKHRTPFEVPDCTQDLGRLKQVDDLQIQSQTYIHNHTLQPLLRRLQVLWGHESTGGNSSGSSSSAQVVQRRLDFDFGQPAGSQLPVFGAPAWLDLRWPSRMTSLNPALLTAVAELPSLAALRCPISLQCTLGVLSSLTGLTELKLYGSNLSSKRVEELQQLKGLRVLSFGIVAEKGSPVLDALQELDFVRDLDLTIGVDAAGQALEALLQRPHAGLRGLTVSGLPLQTSFVAQLAELTHLTSLQLVKTVASNPFLDLTAWRRLSGLQQLTLEVTKPLELMQLRFVPPPPPPKPAQVLTGAASSVGKRRKSAAQQQLEQNLQQLDRPEDRTKFGDASAMLAAWPHLQALKLSGLPPYAVAYTSWEGLSSLTALTSLALLFEPPNNMHRCIADNCRGLKQPPESPGGAMPVLRLEHLAAGLAALQLTNAYVGVPAAGMLRAGEALRSVSLARCHMGSVTKGVSTRAGYPVILRDSPAQPDSLAAARTAGSASTLLPPLLQFLQHTPQLHMLELIHLPWLSDALLSAAAAQTQLRALRSLSVVGIGNQHLTHGALLGLTRLSKLRELRWHVGSVLDLMPDVQALAQLQGLMIVHFPHWLCGQFERWGGYAVLDSMPLCDVNAELV